MKNRFLIILTLGLFIPVLVNASWWNPLSWFGFSQRPKTTTSTTWAPQATSTIPATTKKIDEEKVIKTIKTEPIKTPPIRVKTPKQEQVTTPVISSWPDLETNGFAEAKQKGWASLTITNQSGEKHFYRLENGSWVRKNTLAEAEQTYLPLPSAPTQEQLAGLQRLCSFVPQSCTTDVLNGYYSNNVFRQGVDSLVSKYDANIVARQQAIKQQQQNCYDITMKGEASLFANMAPGDVAGAMQDIRNICNGTFQPDQNNYQLSKLQSQMQQISSDNQKIQQQLSDQQFQQQRQKIQ